MNSLDRAVEAIKLGVPMFIVRNAHPELIIRDEEHNYKIVPKNDIANAVYLRKVDLQYNREVQLNVLWKS